MNALKIFENPEFGKVRTIEIDGEPWFLGKDIAEILEYINTNKAISMHIDEEDKKILDFKGFSHFGYNLWGENDFSNKIIINESGLYCLILSSKLPKAKEFKHWITSEVIPSIRKHGAYMTPDTIEQAISNPDFLIKLATELKTEQEKRKQLEIKAEEDKPKVLFADSVSTAKNSILVGDLAKILKQNGIDIGQKRLFEWLRANGYLIKGGNSKNMPTQKSADMGLFEVKVSTISNPDGSIRETKTTKVTGKGQVYFVNAFLSPKQ